MQLICCQVCSNSRHISSQGKPTHLPTLSFSSVMTHTMILIMRDWLTQRTNWILHSESESELCCNFCQVPDRMDHKHSTYLPQVPEEVCLFHAHICDTSCRTNDENGSTRPSTVGYQLPDLCIHRERGDAVHTHGGCHQGYIIDNCRCKPYCSCNQLHTWYVWIEICRQVSQDPCRLQTVLQPTKPPLSTTDPYTNDVTRWIWV